MKPFLRRLLGWSPGMLALLALLLPWLGASWDWFFPFYPRPDGGWSTVLGGMGVAFAIALAMVLPGFLRLRTLSRRTKGLVLGGSLGFGLVVALALEASAGGWVALGLTAQLAAGITWSERCHVMLGGRCWQRVAWAVVGVLVPISVLATPPAVLMTFLYRGARVSLPVGYPIVIGVSLLVLLAAGIHHLRARSRAQEWRLARETGEYPELPQPVPGRASTTPHSGEAS